MRRVLLMVLLLTGVTAFLHAQKGTGTGADSLPPPPFMTAGYTITEAPGWIRTDTLINSTYITVLISPEDSVSDKFRENLNIIMEPCGDISLVEYFEAAETQFNKLPNFQLYGVSDTTINGLSFKRVDYSIQNEQLAADITTYLMIHDEVAYIFTCSALKGDRLRWKPVYEQMITSFKFD